MIPIPISPICSHPWENPQGADVPSASHVTAEALAVAVAAEDAAQWTGRWAMAKCGDGDGGLFQRQHVEYYIIYICNYMYMCVIYIYI